MRFANKCCFAAKLFYCFQLANILLLGEVTLPSKTTSWPSYSITYCMPQTVGHVRLDTLEEWYQEANVSTILLTDREH